MKTGKIVGRGVIFAIITAVCLGVVAGLYALKPKNEIKSNTIAPLQNVTIKEVKPGAYHPNIRSFGEVKPKWTTTLRAQTSGEIRQINDRLQPGDRLCRGDLILKMDQSVYLAAVAQAKEALADAKVNLLKAERRADQARSDWKRSGFEARPSSPLVFHEPQLKAAKARVMTAESALKKALRDIEHTIVTAPYDGLVIERSADKGETVFSGDNILTMVSTKEIEIAVKLDAAKLETLGTAPEDAAVIIVNEARGISCQGKIVRDSGVIDTKTRLHTLYIAPTKYVSVKMASKKGEPGKIIPGMFVTVFIKGQRHDNLLAVPESSLTRDGFVWYADSHNKLQSFKPEVVFFDDGMVYLKNTDNLQQLRVVVAPVRGYIQGTAIHPLYDKEEA